MWTPLIGERVRFFTQSNKPKLGQSLSNTSALKLNIFLIYEISSIFLIFEMEKDFIWAKHVFLYRDNIAIEKNLNEGT